MKSSIKANLAAHRGDLRIDFARGLANWFILVDHVPQDAVNLLTLRNFGFSGAADVFVLVTGYAAAILFGKMTVERGFVVTTTRIFRRVGKLYAVHLVVFVLYISTIGWVAAGYAAPDIIAEYHVVGILSDPIRMLMHGLFLLSKPLNLDILQLLITLLAVFPFALASLLRWPNLTLSGSIALYAAARLFGLNLPAYPAGSTYLNPFTWQLVFVLGAWLALHGGDLVRSLQELRTLRLLAVAYLLFALLVSLAGKDPALHSLLPDFLVSPFTPNDRDNLAPYRLLHLLALALLFTRFVPADGDVFDTKAVQPILKCGEEWLACFCGGVFLSFAGHFVLITSPNSLLLQIGLSVAGIAMMTAFAYYVSWSKRQDHAVRLGARA